jgi:hypothetical protein
VTSKTNPRASPSPFPAARGYERRTYAAPASSRATGPKNRSSESSTARPPLRVTTSRTPSRSRLLAEVRRPKHRRADALDTVVEHVNSARTQNGHIRNDTRDVSRHIRGARLRPICRRNCVASDRECTRVPPENLHGKECDEEGPPRVTGSGLSSGSYREEARLHVVRRSGSQSQAPRLPSARR